MELKKHFDILLILFCRGSEPIMEKDISLMERLYICRRVFIGKIQGILFYLCRVFPIDSRKIVFCCIEGTTGYTCNPKYMARELIRRGSDNGDYKLIWLVNDTSKKFPPKIKVVKNTLLNRAYHLTTAKVWIDNSRKQLECRKRKGQIYIQTWHAKIGFKPTCLDRGKSFSRIAYIVSKHDSNMVDYWLSNSDWYDKTLPKGSLYNGKILRTGSPRCDILVKGRKKQHLKIREEYGLPDDAKIIMYAPTFRGGSQGTDRLLQIDEGTLDYDMLVTNLEKKFGGKWYIFLRRHPQLVVRKIKQKANTSVTINNRIIDVSRVDDMYRLLAGCDAFITDYSSAAFDAAVMEIPIFLYCDDHEEYEKERGLLLWDLEKLPFGLAQDNDELRKRIEEFDNLKYQQGILAFFAATGMAENGDASEKAVDFICKQVAGG